MTASMTGMAEAPVAPRPPNDVGQLMELGVGGPPWQLRRKCAAASTGTVRDGMHCPELLGHRPPSGRGRYPAVVMAPWRRLRGPFLAAWLLGVVCLVVAAILYFIDYDRFSWPPIIAGLLMAGAALNLVAALSRGEEANRD